MRKEYPFFKHGRHFENIGTIYSFIHYQSKLIIWVLNKIKFIYFEGHLSDFS